MVGDAKTLIEWNRDAPFERLCRPISIWPDTWRDVVCPLEVGSSQPEGVVDCPFIMIYPDSLWEISSSDAAGLGLPRSARPPQP